MKITVLQALTPRKLISTGSVPFTYSATYVNLQLRKKFLLVINVINIMYNIIQRTNKMQIWQYCLLVTVRSLYITLL